MGLDDNSILYKWNHKWITASRQHMKYSLGLWYGLGLSAYTIYKDQHKKFESKFKDSI